MSDPLPRSLGVLIPPGFSSRGRRVLGVSPLPGYNLLLLPLSPPVSPSLKIFLSLPVSRTCVKRESPGKISPYLKDIIRKLSYFEQLIQPTNFLLLYTGLTDCAALHYHMIQRTHRHRLSWLLLRHICFTVSYILFPTPS